MNSEVLKMKAVERQHEWTKHLKFFSEQNAGRPTRLGVFEPSSGVAADYWIECGLPLFGVDMDIRGDAIGVQIKIGSLTHETKNVVKLSFQLTASGEEDGLDVLDADGRLTVLRFETNRDRD